MQLERKVWSTVSFLFLFEIFRCTETLDLWEIEDHIIRDVIRIYQQVPVEIRDLHDKPVNPTNIKLNLYTGSQPNQKVPIDLFHQNPIVFQNNSRIFFLIHGWLDNCGRLWWTQIRDVLLQKNPHCSVVTVDWSIYAKRSYFVAANDAKVVGEILGKFIVNLYENHSISLDKFVLIGHSLGGHIAGFVGKTVTELTNLKLPRIIALDLAGPEFYTKPGSERLNKTDARVVVVIHTSDGSFGFKASCGTVDFFPNGGNAQPGCRTSFLLFYPLQFLANVGCNHARSKAYFVEGILSPDKFLARKCDNWETYVTNQESCDDEYVSVADLETMKTGNFYLHTTAAPPYY